MIDTDIMKTLRLAEDALNEALDVEGNPLFLPDWDKIRRAIKSVRSTVVSMKVASQQSTVATADATIQRVALAMINAVRKQHGFDTILWTDPRLSPEDTMNYLMLARTALEVVAQQGRFIR